MLKTPVKRAALYGICLVLCLNATGIFQRFLVQAQSDESVPPPLAFSSLRVDDQEYHVLDFASGEMTTIPRLDVADDSSDIFILAPDLPPEVILQSPFQQREQVKFINETTSPPENVGYTIYRVQPDGTLWHVADRGFPATPLEWSADGRYVYFEADRTTEGRVTLYQLEFDSTTLTPLLSGNRFDYNCHPNGLWCLVRYQITPERNSPVEIALLETNSGQLWQLGRIQPVHEWVRWRGTIPAFIYLAYVDDQHSAIHQYNFEAHTDTQLGTVDSGAIALLIWSPDLRWLAVTDYQAVFVMDTQAENSPPQRISADLAPVAETFLHWSDNQHLFFDHTLRRENAPTQYHYYTVNVGQGALQAVARIDTTSRIIDDAWTPDGRWLALSFSDAASQNALYLLDGLARRPLQAIAVPFPPEDAICLGWESESVYSVGQAYLCDFAVTIPGDTSPVN